MSGYSGHHDRDRVLEATDLVSLIGEHVTLRRKGREHVGLCPFHDDHTPSMHVVTHKGTGFFKCFACGESGSALDFVIKHHKMSFIEALRFLADRAGIELTARQREESDAEAPSRAQLVEANTFAMRYFQEVLRHPQAGLAARQTIENRGIAPEMVEAFGIGAAPNDWEALATIVRKRALNLRAFQEAGLLKERAVGQGLRDAFVHRLVFPIFDQLGRPIAFGGRVLNPDDQPKYLNSAESPVFPKSRTLFGLHLARKAIEERGFAIITEGYIDVVAMHQHGFANTVATLGTALSADHAKILGRLCDSVTLLFDGDEAGQKAADRAVEVFFTQPIDVRICVLPGGDDPDDLLRADGGRPAMESHLGSAVDALTFMVQRFRAVLAKSDSGASRQKRLEEFGARLADLGYWSMSGVRKAPVLLTLAQLFRVSIDDVERHIPRRRSRPSPASTEALVEPKDRDPGEELMSSRAPRARRMAEEDLIALLVFRPALASQQVDAGDGHLLPLTEILLPADFEDPPCRRLYEAIQSGAESGRETTIPAVQAAVGGGALARLVTDLFVHGRDICQDNDERARARLEGALQALDNVRGRDDLRSRVGSIRGGQAPAPDVGTPAFMRVLDERRRLGDDRAVLPRKVRS